MSTPQTDEEQHQQECERCQLEERLRFEMFSATAQHLEECGFQETVNVLTSLIATCYQFESEQSNESH